MSLPILDDVRIASPCNVPWEGMSGDDRKRHCGQCDLDVYNLSSMSRAEAQKFLRVTEGRACVRLYKRFDGTVITRDCPVGWRKVRRAVRRRVMLSAIFVLGLFSVGIGAFASSRSACHDSVSDGDAFDSPLLAQIVALFKGQPVLQPPPVIMGKMPYYPTTPVPRPATPVPTP